MSGAGGRGPRDKGNRGEAEVVRIWRDNGWPKARRQPMSGGARPYGARDQAPWPFDVGGVNPFVVSVKLDKELAVPGRSSKIPGEAFVRECIRELERWWVNRAIGQRAVPVLWARPGQGEGSNAWDVWTPAPFLLDVASNGKIGESLNRQVIWDWARLPWWAFMLLIGSAEDWA